MDDNTARTMLHVLQGARTALGSEQLISTLVFFSESARTEAKTNTQGSPLACCTGRVSPKTWQSAHHDSLRSPERCSVKLRRPMRLRRRNRCSPSDLHSPSFTRASSNWRCTCWACFSFFWLLPATLRRCFSRFLSIYNWLSQAPRVRVDGCHLPRVCQVSSVLSVRNMQSESTHLQMSAASATLGTASPDCLSKGRDRDTKTVVSRLSLRQRDERAASTVTV